jgi:hypothetical protein
VVDQQHQRRAQQLGHPGRLPPPLGKAQMQRLLPRLRAKRSSQLAHQTLAFGVQHPRQTPACGMRRGGQGGQGRESRSTPRLAGSQAVRTRKINRLLSNP